MNNVENLSLMLQAISLIILLNDYNNSDLMQELQRQDTLYLETIINQNKKILNKLEEITNE